MNATTPNHDRILPTDTFDKSLSRLVGLPDGAHTQPSVVQAIDFYGNVTSYMVQTVRWDEGTTVFVTQVDADNPPKRVILPPKVMTTILRQHDAVATMIRRRHGRRLAEQRKANGHVPTFTPEARAKGLATRKAKAARRRARKAGAR